MTGIGMVRGGGTVTQRCCPPRTGGRDGPASDGESGAEVGKVKGKPAGVGVGKLPSRREG